MLSRRLVSREKAGLGRPRTNRRQDRSAGDQQIVVQRRASHDRDVQQSGHLDPPLHHALLPQLSDGARARLLTSAQGSMGNAHVHRLVAGLRDGQARLQSAAARKENSTGATAIVEAFEERLLATTPYAPVELVEAVDAARPPVTIHRGGVAGELLARAGTPAAALGSDVVLAPGAPSLDSAEGRRLLAHEMVHTAQQRFRAPEPSGAMTGRVAAEAAATGATAGHDSTLKRSSQVHYLGGDSVLKAIAKRALKWLGKKGKNVSAHIAKRHIAKRLGKTTFTGGGKFVKKLIRKTMEQPDNIVDQGRRIVFEKNFGRKVGQGGEEIVRVVVDKVTGKIITAFPTAAFRAGLTVAAIATASAAATEADAAILDRRAAIKKAGEPSNLEQFIDLLFGYSSVARDEDVLVEERIIEEKIQEAITAIEEEMQVSLSPDQRDDVRETILLEMDTVPEPGVID